MDTVWIGIAGVTLLIVLLASGVYVAVAMGIAGLLGTIAIVGFFPAMSLLATTWFQYGTTYAFIIIPLFVMMGLFASQAGVSRDLYDSLSKWLGGIRGGLGCATVGACTIFGALTGSSIVTAVVFGKVSVPEMRRLGYNGPMAYGLVSAAGAIGLLIPPNLLAVIYGILTGESIGKLLLAGIGPGLVLAFCLVGGLIFLLTWRPSMGPPAQEKSATWRERFTAVPKMWPAFVIAIILIGGIYTGVFTETEASGVGTFILLILLLAVRGIGKEARRELVQSIRDSVGLTGMVLLIMCCGQIFSRMLVLSGLGNALSNYIISLKLSPMGFIAGVMGVYFILGCLIDSASIIVVTVPILYPMAGKLGIDQIWFAMVLILATQIGNITPPVGLVAYAVKGIAAPDITLEDIFRGVFPFFFCMCAALAILIAFPFIATLIPYTMFGR